MNLTEELQTYSSEEVEQLLSLTDELQTENEQLRQITNKQEQQIREQKQQIQTLLSDKQRLSSTTQRLTNRVEEQNKQQQEMSTTIQTQKSQIAQQAEQIKNLNENNQKLKKNANESAVNYRQIIEQSVKARTDKIRDEIYVSWSNYFYEKFKRIQNFIGTSLAIVLIALICVTSLLISDHARVFVGKTGVVNFFTSLCDGAVSICTSTMYILDSAISTLTETVSVDVAQAIIYGLFVILVFIGAVIFTLKVFPNMRQKFKNVIQTYKKRGSWSYNKSMTVSLCAIAMCCAVLVAEYAMFNVITTWLILSVSFNVLYHLIAYKIQ